MQESEYDVTLSVTITAQRRIKAVNLEAAERIAEQLYIDLPYDDYESASEPDIYVNERKEQNKQQ